MRIEDYFAQLAIKGFTDNTTRPLQQKLQAFYLDERLSWDLRLEAGSLAIQLPPARADIFIDRIIADLEFIDPVANNQHIANVLIAMKNSLNQQQLACIVIYADGKATEIQAAVTYLIHRNQAVATYKPMLKKWPFGWSLFYRSSA